MMVQWMNMQTPQPHTHAKGGQPTETQNAPTTAYREQTNKERKLLWYKQALEKGKAKGGKKEARAKGRPLQTMPRNRNQRSSRNSIKRATSTNKTRRKTERKTVKTRQKAQRTAWSRKHGGKTTNKHTQPQPR